MSDWGRLAYGDPCHECGYHWSIGADDAVDLVRALPARYRTLLAGATGAERAGHRTWSAGSYVCHVADNLRIWAERLAGVEGGGVFDVTAYDQDRLAEARRYEGVALPAALWSLERSVADWVAVVGRARERGTVIVHPDRGPLSADDVARLNAHDANHHGWDIAASLR